MAIPLAQRMARTQPTARVGLLTCAIAHRRLAAMPSKRPQPSTQHASEALLHHEHHLSTWVPSSLLPAVSAVASTTAEPDSIHSQRAWLSPMQKSLLLTCPHWAARKPLICKVRAAPSWARTPSQRPAYRRGRLPDASAALLAKRPRWRGSNPYRCWRAPHREALRSCTAASQLHLRVVKEPVKVAGSAGFSLADSAQTGVQDSGFSYDTMPAMRTRALALSFKAPGLATVYWRLRTCISCHVSEVELQLLAAAGQRTDNHHCFSLRGSCVADDLRPSLAQPRGTSLK